jgi:hypothetical protein
MKLLGILSRHCRAMYWSSLWEMLSYLLQRFIIDEAGGIFRNLELSLLNLLAELHLGGPVRALGGK